MRPSVLALITCCCLPPAALSAQDLAGSSDHRLFPRIAGYRISQYRDTDPVVEEFRNGQGYERDTVEGRVTRILYSLPRGGSQTPTPPLGLVRHYEGIVQRFGGTVLYRQPSYGELTGRLVQNGREFWIRIHAENLEEYGVVVAERSAPVRAGAMALAAGPGASSGSAALPPAALRRFSFAAAQFALDTGWVPVVQPTRGMSHAIVSIRGAHVEDATEVRFGEYPARILDRTASEITVVVPVRPVGLVPVIVSGPAGARTARDSFQVYQEPVSDGSRDMRMYTCTQPQIPDAPSVTSFSPATVRTGDTLVINGDLLDQVQMVSFTYYLSSSMPSVLRGRDPNWNGGGSMLDGYVPMDVQRQQIASLPISQTATSLTVVVPIRARSGPVALFRYGRCVVSDQALGVRVGPAPR